MLRPSNAAACLPLSRRGTLGLGLGLAAAAAARASAALAQPGAADWPGRPVRYIESFQPGSAPDTNSRLWCAAMAEITGQQFVVENRVGAGGTIGATAIARAAPDGHTIGQGGIATHAIAPTLYTRLPYDAVRDFTLISGLLRGPNVLAVNNDLPARSVPELIELLRREPGRHLYGHGGLGTSGHLAMELFKARTGVEIGQVAYAGPQVQLDLMAGRVQALCAPLSGSIARLREGKFRALAVTSPERSPAMPDAPALAEFLPGFDVISWGMLVGPAGIPPVLVERIFQFSKRALARPDLVQRFQEAGNTPWPAAPAELAAYRAEQEALLAPLIRASGVRVE